MMKYIVKFIMEGAFPGSPDIDTYELTSEDWSVAKKIVENLEQF